MRVLRHPTTAEHLDDALVLYFPGPRSYTGEPVLELHVHGSPAVVRDVLMALTEIPATTPFRPASPGEFTRRAFENGRMDLTSCESLDALLRAETSTQRRLALQTGGGRQKQLYTALRNALLEAMVRIEAMLDFSDQDEIDADLWDPVVSSVREIRMRLQKELQRNDATYVDAVLHGTRLVLYGRPNAGKSMLLNRLVRREAAIVSAEPGTTRDSVQVTLELEGFRVVLTDTAGIRQPSGEVEREGIARTHGRSPTYQTMYVKRTWRYSYAMRTKCRVYWAMCPAQGVSRFPPTPSSVLGMCPRLAPPRCSCLSTRWTWRSRLSLWRPLRLARHAGYGRGVR